jgi:hypothetical protein
MGRPYAKRRRGGTGGGQGLIVAHDDVLIFPHETGKRGLPISHEPV